MDRVETETSCCPICTAAPDEPGAYFSVHYYTKCALLKAGCDTFRIDMCNIKICKKNKVIRFLAVRKKGHPEFYLGLKRSPDLSSASFSEEMATKIIKRSSDF